MRSIALVGKSGSGKTSVARFLNLHFGTEIVSTGAICRNIATLLFGNDDKATTQRLDDALTALDPSIFLKAALRNVPGDAIICVDALRFKNDLEVARDRGLVTVRISAPEEMRNQRLAERKQGYNPEKDRLHRSETDLEEVQVDHSIINTGSREELEIAVRSLCQNI